jgi:hypothetical protein
MATFPPPAIASSLASSRSSTSIAFDALRRTAQLYGRVLRAGWLRLITLHNLFVAIAQILQYATDLVRESAREDITWIALIAIAEMIASLIWWSAWYVAVAETTHAETYDLPPPPLFSSLGQHLNRLLIEQTRALARVLWWVPALILPAGFQYVRLSFVPFVVIFDRDYKHGRVDALEKSSRLSRGRFWLLALTVLVSFAIPAVFEEVAQGSGGSSILSNPFGVSLGAVLTLFINLATSMFLYLVFEGASHGLDTTNQAQIKHEASDAGI